MKNIPKITPYNSTKSTKCDFSSPQALQRLKKEILDFFIRLGLKDIKRHPVLNSGLVRAIKFIESGKQVEAYDLYKQIISLLKTLQKKTIFNIGTHYKDTVNIKEQHAACQKKEEELSKTISTLTEQKLKIKEAMKEIGTKMQNNQLELFNTNKNFKKVIEVCCEKCKKNEYIGGMTTKLGLGRSQSKSLFKKKSFLSFFYKGKEL